VGMHGFEVATCCVAILPPPWLSCIRQHYHIRRRRGVFKGSKPPSFKSTSRLRLAKPWEFFLIWVHLEWNCCKVGGK
jgi:hypothetical protein